jgi:hypothetical protein
MNTTRCLIAFALDMIFGSYLERPLDEREPAFIPTAIVAHV